MTERSRYAETECRVFCRYLAEADPSPYVVEHYLRAGVTSRPPTGPVDRALLRVATRGAWFTRAADAYAAVFARQSSLRQRLVLCTAILENVGETADVLDSADTAGPAGLVCRAIPMVAYELFLVVVGALLLAVTTVGHALGGGDEQT